jgi:hypothetical protein
MGKKKIKKNKSYTFLLDTLIHAMLDTIKLKLIT